VSCFNVLRSNSKYQLHPVCSDMCVYAYVRRCSFVCERVCFCDIERERERESMRERERASERERERESQCIVFNLDGLQPR